MTAPEPLKLTPPWAYYRRTGLSEMRPYVPKEPLATISVSAPDMDTITRALTEGRDPGGYIARNPKNHADQWYVAQAYFDENLEPLDEPATARDEAAELRAENERLRADLFEYVLDGFVQGAHRQEDGGYNTGGVSTYRDLGDWLVEHAHWTRRPGGRGRNQVYDPPKTDAASEGEA